MMQRIRPRGRRSEALSVIILGIAVAAITLFAMHFVAPLRQASDWLDDLRLAYLTPLEEQSDAVVVLAIDEETLKRLPYRSPVDRGFLAEVLHEITAGHDVRAIGVDIIFDQPTVPEQDARLRRAILESPVPVVIARGEQDAGLSAEQLEFQNDYLDGMRSGSAMLAVESGAIRTWYPDSPVSGAPTFVRALLEAAGMPSPDEPVRILFRRAASDNARPVRVFPAHTAALLPRRWLDDQIVLIGADLTDRDRHRTPLSILGGDYEFMPGVMVHAQTLAQIAAGSRVPTMATASDAAIVTAAVAFGLLLALAPLRPLLRIGAALLLVAGYWLTAFSAPVFAALPLPLIGPTVGFAIAAALATALARQRERRQRLFLHGAFNQYVSREIIDDILENPGHLELGGELREMSFIFTDIAGFSTLAERLAPDELVTLLRDYLDGIVEVALANRGTIARFVGDGLVIFFGAPVSDPDHRDRALQCALDMDAFSESYRRREPVALHDLGVTRIGVHSGKAVVGNVGGRRRFEYTAHGDVVNTAARLEGANRHLGTRVCMSRNTARVRPPEEFRPVGNVIVKGRATAIELVTLWDDMDVQSRNDYLEAYELMKRNDPAAMRLLEMLAVRRRHDRLIAMHLARLERGDTGVTFALEEK